MESLLGNLFGDKGSDDDRRAKAQDFVDRVETGSPTEGFSTEEALTNYSKVASNLSPQELQDAATQALERFSPEQRREFSQLLHSKTGAAGAPTDDPRQIAQLTSQLQSQSPDGLLGLLGGGGGLEGILGGLTGGGSSGGGGGLVNDLLGGLLGGGDKKSSDASTGGAQQGGLGDLLGNPIAQAILAAIAAMAMKKFMGGHDAKQAPQPSGGLGGVTPKQASQQGGWQPTQDKPAAGLPDQKPQRSHLKGVDSKEA
jgi:hypothetical protein